MPTLIAVRQLVRTIATIATISMALPGPARAQEQASTAKPSAKHCEVEFLGAKEIAGFEAKPSGDNCTWTLTDKAEHKRGSWESWPLFGIKIETITIDEKRLKEVKVGEQRDPARRTPAASLQFEPTGPGWPEDVVQGPASGIKSLATAYSSRPALFVWSNLAGTLSIDYDDPTVPVAVTISVVRLKDARNENDGKSLDEWAPADWQELLRAGYSVTMTVEPGTYQTLMQFARCVQVGPDETSCLEGLHAMWPNTRKPSPMAWQSVFPNNSAETRPLEYSSDKDAVTADIYHLISRWLGRDPAFDFTTSTGKKRARPSKSEPIVLFAGISGLNKIAILDCQHQAEQRLTNDSSYYRCSDFARPSAQTLERAKHFWAIYVEDADAPFDTTIEAEFGATARNPDYEEFDPRVVPVAASNQTLPRTVRIGFRRFRIREAPSVAQVAFTRQGPSYGLRQWVRVYNQRSQWWAIPAGNVVVPAFAVTQERVALINTPPAGGVGPNVLTIATEERDRLLFAAASVQWPQLRAKADDSGTWQRLWYNLPPDVTAGLADMNIFFLGGSWPIPVWRDRTYLTLGTTVIGHDVLKDGYAIGQQVPLATTREDIIDNSKDWQFGFRIGITIELFRIRR